MSEEVAIIMVAVVLMAARVLPDALNLYQARRELKKAKRAKSNE